MLGGGAFKQAMRFAGENQSPVWHYVVAFDSPYEQDTSRHYAWHTAELPLEMRIVRYPEESEALSRKISAVWAAFICNMDPSLSDQPWPAFDPVARIVMVIDRAWYLARDPHRKIREAIEQATR